MGGREVGREGEGEERWVRGRGGGEGERVGGRRGVSEGGRGERERGRVSVGWEREGWSRESNYSK